jgi:hypothetical protein
MPIEEPMTFMIEDAQIVFRNFSGEEGQYNAKGNREFSVILDPDSAKKMLNDGWNVKQLTPRDEGEEGDWYITITVGYKAYPPRIVMITSTSRVNLTEETVGSLDWAEILQADLIARAYRWEVGAKTGIKAYLKSLFVTIHEDELERKYGIETGVEA